MLFVCLFVVDGGLLEQKVTEFVSQLHETEIVLRIEIVLSIED